MEEFFEINKITDLLSVVAFIITIIMFFPWIKQNKPFVEKLFNLSGLLNLFYIVGSYWVIQSNWTFALVSYFSGWIVSIVIYFRAKEKKLLDIKRSFFSLLIATVGVFTLFQLSLIDRLMGTFEQYIEVQVEVVNNQSSLLEHQISTTESIERLVQNQSSMISKLQIDK